MVYDVIFHSGIVFSETYPKCYFAKYDNKSTKNTNNIKIKIPWVGAVKSSAGKQIDV